MTLQTLRIPLLVLLMALFSLNGCKLYRMISPGQEGQKNERATPQNVLDKFDIDPETGVIYYIPEDQITNYTLPDGSSIELVSIPAGEFIMGNNNIDKFSIQNAGLVRVSVNEFFMGRHEVTNAQYRAFLSSLSGAERTAMLPDSTAWAREIGTLWRDYFHNPEFDNYPVVCVNWNQARAFAEWAGLRLPVESEWEYAARSGVSGRVYPWEGINTQSRVTGKYYANFAPRGEHGADGYIITAPVDAFPANNFRLKNMAGNVAEWTKDAYFPSYASIQASSGMFVTPSNLDDNEPRKIVRGGSWASSEFYIGVGVRDFRFQEHSSTTIGFRVAANVSTIMRSERDEAQIPDEGSEDLPQPVLPTDDPQPPVEEETEGEGNG